MLLMVLVMAAVRAAAAAACQRFLSRCYCCVWRGRPDRSGWERQRGCTPPAVLFLVLFPLSACLTSTAPS